MTTASPTDGTDVRQLFDRMVGHEPPLGLDAGAALHAGRRLRRRRQMRTGLVGVTAVVTVGAVGAGLVVLPADDDQPGTMTAETAEGVLPVAALSSPGSPGAAPESAPQQEQLSRLGEQAMAAVRGASPAGWTFDLGEYGEADGPGGGLMLDGTVDDGLGASRLLVALATQPGQQMLHPCGDADFTAGGAQCDETVLPDGSVLSVRGLTDWDGIRTVVVVLTHPDGTGVTAESGNFQLATPQEVAELAEEEARRQAETGELPTPVTIETPMEAARPDPAYTTEQLTAVVEAVATAIA